MDDTSHVIVNETLIQDAVLKASPENMDGVLAAVEAYRTCVATARKLVRVPNMAPQRQQVLECAAFCEEKLATFAVSGRLGKLQYPKPGTQFGHFVLTMEW